MYKTSLLIVDDEVKLLRLLKQQLERKGFEVTVAASGSEFRNAIEERSFDVVLLDVRLPDADGVDLLRELKAREPLTAVVMMTGHGTIENAVNAMKHGAVDYITKPCTTAELETVLERASDTVRLRRHRLATRLSGRKSEIIGSSTVMAELLERACRAAASDLPVLVHGESGTGKELVSQLIRQQSNRSEDPFLIIDCAVLSDSLLASELFGHEKGAFTGADERREGLFEAANGGTVFLDEIGDIGQENQSKLLRILDSGEYRRLGSNTTRKTDVRLVAATNRDLRKLVADGQFREDLYHRLAAITLILPPLRERREDIRELALHFLDAVNLRQSREFRLSDAALSAMEGYGWPGNIRELRNAIEQSTVFCSSDEIQLDDLTPEIRFGSYDSHVDAAEDTSALGPILDLAEREHISKVLAVHQGNRAQTAEALGISIRALFNKLKQHELG